MHLCGIRQMANKADVILVDERKLVKRGQGKQYNIAITTVVTYIFVLRNVLVDYLLVYYVLCRGCCLFAICLIPHECSIKNNIQLEPH